MYIMTYTMQNDQFKNLYESKKYCMHSSQRKQKLRQYFQNVRQVINFPYYLKINLNYFSELEFGIDHSIVQLHNISTQQQLFKRSKQVLTILNEQYDRLSKNPIMITIIPKLLQFLIQSSQNQLTKLNCLCALRIMLEYPKIWQIINLFNLFNIHIFTGFKNGLLNVLPEYYFSCAWIIIEMCKFQSVINQLFNAINFQSSIHVLLKMADISSMCKLHAYEIICFGLKNHNNCISVELIRRLFLQDQFSTQDSIAQYQQQLMQNCIQIMQVNELLMIINANFLHKCKKTGKIKLIQLILQRMRSQCSKQQFCQLVDLISEHQII